MSLLDIIKNLFGNKSDQQPETQVQPETKPEPVEPIAEEKPAPVVESTPAPAPVEKKEQAEQTSIPEDSTLRRHYLANQEALKQPKYVEPAAPIVEPEPVIAEVAEPAEEKQVETVVKLQVPQDSTLKRHFIAGLRAEIESNMPTRPSDATLRRHYDAEVQAELDKLLS